MKPITVARKFYTRAEVAHLLGFHPSTIARWDATGKSPIPPVRLGGSVRYPAQAVDRMAAELGLGATDGYQK